MLKFSTHIKRAGKLGEKTGWSYIDISAAQAQRLNPGVKVGYRVKGFLDHHPIKHVAIMPMGKGNFILPLNAKLRKLTGKQMGDPLTVTLQLDARVMPISPDFMKCLMDDNRAINHFKTLSGSHQRYFSKWIEDAKTLHTKTKRITMAVIALASGQGYPEMMRSNRRRRD